MAKTVKDCVYCGGPCFLAYGVPFYVYCSRCRYQGPQKSSPDSAKEVHNGLVARLNMLEKFVEHNAPTIHSPSPGAGGEEFSGTIVSSNPDGDPIVIALND